MSKSRFSRTLSLIAFFCAFLCVGAINSHAQNFTTLLIFDGANGANPKSVTLVQAMDGNLYGTTSGGGSTANCSGGCGTIFKISLDGKLTTLHNFCAQPDCTEGMNPQAGLIQARDGNFYGTTLGGGTHSGNGTVFRITSSGMLTTIYSFCAMQNCADGYSPNAALVQGSDGNLYGTTSGGGTKDSGTVFKVTAAGALTTLYSFCMKADCADGSNPVAELTQGADGNLYGMTSQGGTGSGTIFKITSSGAVTTTYTFCSKPKCTDGGNPKGALIQAADGSFYGTTFSGGTRNAGTVFNVTAQGALSTIFSFGTGSAEGATPYATLVQGTDGNFYGTAYYGGAKGQGTVFKVVPPPKVTSPTKVPPTWKVIALHSFDDSDAYPIAALMQDTDGNFYGTTFNGGSSPKCLNSGGCGTVFRLSAGLGPFVKLQPRWGAAGSNVVILGTNLTGTTAVAFNDTAASFKVVSASEITTTVPPRAASGPVKVTLPSSALTSNVNFSVP
jgi:uncharacterized repeat protein (TIGR03803 family)